MEVSEVARIVRAEVAGAAGGMAAPRAAEARSAKGANGAPEAHCSGSGVGSAHGRPVLTVRELGGRVGELSADHVIAATGYRVDIAAMDFLGHELRTELAVSRGTPRLGAGYASSVPGLYFTGLPAAASYGPVMRFVCGTEFASPRLAGHLAAAHG